MKTDKAISLNSLKLMYNVLEKQDDYSNDALFSSLRELASSNALKNGQIFWPLRTALTGLQSSPGGATEIAHILGKQETLKRIIDAIELLAEMKG